MFPHPNGWKEAATHGAWVVRNGTEPCIFCHGGTATEGKTPPACASCHALFPHPDKWVQKENHGATVARQGTAACATLCHGTDLAGGLSGISCNSCHSIFPHPQGFESGQLHGPPAIADIGICKTCHGDSLDSAQAGSKSCKDCHPTYIQHASARVSTVAWNTFDGHGSLLKNRSWDAADCLICHGSNFAGGISKVGCRASSCHPSYPHKGLMASEWKGRDGHAKYVHDTMRGDMSACAICHGADFNGGTSQVGCRVSSCHPPYPHKGLTGGEWKERDGHAVYIRDVLGGDRTSCTLCHGADLKGGHSGISCFDCHPDYPHPAGWKLGSAHGKSFSGSFDSNSAKATCWGCHGATVAFNDKQTKKTDLTGRLDCFGCHWAYPHTGYDVPPLSAWKPDGHVIYLIRSLLFTNNCGDKPKGPDDPFLTGPPLCPDGTMGVGALRNTCGRFTAGECHFNGYRSKKSGSTSWMCGKFCHK